MPKEGQINNTTKGIPGRAKEIMEQEINNIRKAEQCMMEERQKQNWSLMCQSSFFRLSLVMTFDPTIEKK